MAKKPPMKSMKPAFMKPGGDGDQPSAYKKKGPMQTVADKGKVSMAAGTPGLKKMPFDKKAARP